MSAEAQHQSSDPAGQTLPVPVEQVEVTVGLGSAPAVPPPPPVAPQSARPAYASKLESEKVVIAAPLSFTGSAARIWKLTHLSAEVWARALLATGAIVLIAIAWTFVLCWYLLWGLWLVPYRLMRRGQRQRKRQALQHRELIAAIKEERRE